MFDGTIPDREPTPPGPLDVVAPSESIVVTDEARKIAVEAVNIARGDGCDCDPNVEMSPTGEYPWWSAMVNHDESCELVRRFQQNPDGGLFLP